MNLAAQWKKKNWGVGVARRPPTTESDSKRTRRPSGSIFTVWHGSLPTACYRRGRVTVTAKESLWNSPRMQTWIFSVQFSGSDVSSDGAHRPDHICHWAERRDQIKRPFFGKLKRRLWRSHSCFWPARFCGPIFQAEPTALQNGLTLKYVYVTATHCATQKHPNKDEESINSPRENQCQRNQIHRLHI